MQEQRRVTMQNNRRTAGALRMTLMPCGIMGFVPGYPSEGRQARTMPETGYDMPSAEP